MSHRITLTRLALVLVVALATAGLAASTASAAVSLSPAYVRHVAGHGTMGKVTITNGSRATLKVRVTARPWIQSRSGRVSPNRRKTLSRYLRLSGAVFTLRPGKRHSVTVTMRSVPSRRALYGAIEAVAIPTKRSSKSGIVAAYRLVGGLRLTPSARSLYRGLKAGSIKVRGRGAYLPVKNIGNTIDSVSGSVRISGKGHLRVASLRGVRILPGVTVNRGLGSLRGLPRGTYTARVTLRQAGHVIAIVRRSLRLR